MADLHEHIRAVLARAPDVLEGYLFGSQARREARAMSDVDVAVYLAPGSSSAYGRDADIAADLMSALGTNAVDVVILNDAPPLLYHRVLHDGVRLFSRDLVATTTREGRAISRYCDFAPQLARIDAAHRARIASGGFGK